MNKNQKTVVVVFEMEDYEIIKKSAEIDKRSIRSFVVKGTIERAETILECSKKSDE